MGTIFTVLTVVSMLISLAACLFGGSKDERFSDEKVGFRS
jgi:hypothetical protein